MTFRNTLAGLLTKGSQILVFSLGHNLPRRSKNSNLFSPELNRRALLCLQTLPVAHLNVCKVPAGPQAAGGLVCGKSGAP